MVSLAAFGAGDAVGSGVFVGRAVGLLVGSAVAVAVGSVVGVLVGSDVGVLVGGTVCWYSRWIFPLTRCEVEHEAYTVLCLEEEKWKGDLLYCDTTFLRGSSNNPNCAIIWILLWNQNNFLIHILALPSSEEKNLVAIRASHPTVRGTEALWLSIKAVVIYAFRLWRYCWYIRVYQDLLVSRPGIEPKTEVLQANGNLDHHSMSSVLGEPNRILDNP